MDIDKRGSYFKRMGVMFINSADSSYTSKQLVGLIFCAGIMLLLSVVNFNFVCGFSRILYLINIVLLVLVKLVGVKVNGAQRWINSIYKTSAVRIDQNYYDNICGGVHTGT